MARIGDLAGCAFPLALVAAGCATSGIGADQRGARLYDGAERPREEVALIRRADNWKLRVSVKSIDGRAISGDAWEVLPGLHAVELALSGHHGESTGGGTYRWAIGATCAGRLEAVAGGDYRIEARFEWERETREARFEAWFAEAGAEGRIGRIDCTPQA